MIDCNDWLIYLFIYLYIYWLIDWLIDWSIGRSIDLFAWGVRRQCCMFSRFPTTLRTSRQPPRCWRRRTARSGANRATAPPCHPAPTASPFTPPCPACTSPTTRLTAAVLPPTPPCTPGATTPSNTHPLSPAPSSSQTAPTPPPTQFSKTLYRFCGPARRWIRRSRTALTHCLDR